MEVNIQKYQAFIISAESGSFTRAAKELNFTQSGISKMIADLEKDWGVILFERKSRQISLTSDGKNLLPYARNLCVEFIRMQQHINDLHSYNTGLIRIGAISCVATIWLPNIIKRFQKDYPNIEYEFLIGDYRNVEEWLATGRVDCGFLRLPDDSRLNYDIIPFYTDQIMVIVPQSHPFADAPFFPDSQFSKESFIFFEKGNTTKVSRIINKYELKKRAIFTTWDDYAIMSMVEKGIGISILPESMLKVMPCHIKAVPLQEPVFSEIGFIARNLKTTPVAVRKFIDYLCYADDNDI